MVTNVVRSFINSPYITNADGPFHILSFDSNQQLVKKLY